MSEQSTPRPDQGATPRDDSAAPANRPKTWGEYFHTRTAVLRAESEASRVFRDAAKRLNACMDRLAELDAWADATNKAVPYTGENDDEQIADVVPVDGES